MIRQLLTITAASLWLLSGCSSGSMSSSKPTDDELRGRSGATPGYVKPIRGGTNKPSYVVRGKRYRVLDTSKGYNEVGMASWYGDKFHGRPTSTGERYDMYEFTAAHKSLPLPTFVRVTNLANDRSVVVKVNDRGPFISGRIIDLSYAAATKLGTRASGVARVRVEALSPFQYRTQALADRAGVKPGAGGVSGKPLATRPSATKPVTGSGGYEVADVLAFDDQAPATTVAEVKTPVATKPAVEPIKLNPVSVEVQPVVAAQPLVSTPQPDKPQTIMFAEPASTASPASSASGCQAGQKRCLQVGVFSEVGKANEVKGKVQQVTSSPVEVRSFEKNGATLYRVLIGPMQPNQFETIAKAVHQTGVYGRFVSF